MHELSVIAAAEAHPSRACLIAEGRLWSYADVATRVRSAVAALRDRGIERGNSVALVPRADVDSVVWLYALFELGAPAMLLHPRLTDRERQELLQDAEPKYTIEEPAPDGDPLQSLPAPSSPPSSETLAVVFTSGSSGAPRGARLSRAAFVAAEAAHAKRLPWEEDDRWALFMPPAHVGGLSILTRSLIARRCVVLGPPGFDPRAVTEVLERDRVTLCSLVPTMLQRLLDLEPAWSPAPFLRAVLVGGAHYPAVLRERAERRAVPALATYGCTEACSQVSTQSPSQRGTPGSGSPLRGLQVRIHRGEIQVRGPTLMDGYLGEERDHEWRTSDGWLRTGDLGSWLSDGQLDVHGRMDDLIVTGGENVAPQEVEAWLQTVPGIEEACVFGVPSDAWGHEVAAALVVDSSAYDPSALSRRLAAELAGYKRPKQTCLVDELPLNRSGKVDRARVRVLCEGRLAPI